jgi:hypothetical protein
MVKLIDLFEEKNNFVLVIRVTKVFMVKLGMIVYDETRLNI